jgi:hypothetical protein
LWATILDDAQTVRIGHAFFDLHSLLAHDAAQKINQRVFVIVQMMLSDSTTQVQLVPQSVSGSRPA